MSPSLKKKNTSLEGKILLYIYLASDLSEDNPLATLQSDTRIDDAWDLVFDSQPRAKILPSLKDRMLVDSAIDAYVRKDISNYNKDMESYDMKLDQLNKLLSDLVPTIKKNVKNSNGMISYTTNLGIISGILKDVVGIVSTKTHLIEVYLNGSSHKIKRGLGKYNKL